jgi:ADP-heptose:LPS heptosyltransferase
MRLANIANISNIANIANDTRPRDDCRSILVHLGAGIGNVVLATPLLIALHELGFTTDVLLAADYPQTADLLRPWSILRDVFPHSAAPDPRGYDVIAPAIPPFYAMRFGRPLANLPHSLPRPPDPLFFQDEQQFYLQFAHALGWSGKKPPLPVLPIGPSREYPLAPGAVVIAPGCKTGEMAAKRWPYFAELSAAFTDVAVIGTIDDLLGPGGAPLEFPSHVRLFAGQLSLRQTAELIAAATIVIGNDSGLTHIAAAVGTPTLMLFGPTPHLSLGPLPPNVHVLRSGLPCEPCWFRDRFRACARRIDCLSAMDVPTVLRALSSLLRPPPQPRSVQNEA